MESEWRAAVAQDPNRPRQEHIAPEVRPQETDVNGDAVIASSGTLSDC